jgi:hypothetical protein
VRVSKRLYHRSTALQFESLVWLFGSAIWVSWFAINLDDLISFILDPLQLPTIRRFDPCFGLQNAGVHIVDLAISQPLLPGALLPRLNDRFIASNRYLLNLDPTSDVLRSHGLFVEPPDMVPYLLIVPSCSIR